MPDPERLFRQSKRIPKLFGILNLTSDSFSDGRRENLDVPDAVSRALRMLDDGADAIDVGAESTRPGAAAQSSEIEIARLVPVITGLRKMRPDCVISVDTRKADVADAVLSCGADWINDVSGFQFDPRMPRIIAAQKAGVILMHMRGVPETMQEPENLIYGDLIRDIKIYFTDRIRLAESAGIRQILLDPGIGFSKTADQNWVLIRRAREFHALQRPLFYGISRKNFLRTVSDTAPAERDFATVGVLAALMEQGVGFLRVHNVKAARETLTAFAAGKE